MKALKTLLLTGMASALSMALSAQCYQTADNGLKFGPDSAKCVEYLSLYSEYYKQKNYEMAQKHWQQALVNCPRSSQNLYIHGPTILRNAIEKEKDTAKRKKLVDSLMCVYDQRIEFFGREGYVLNRKGVDLLQLSDNTQQGFDILKKGIALEGVKSEATPLIYYFKAACDLLGQEKLTREEVLGIFQEVSDIIEKNLQQDPDDKAFQVAQENVERFFVSCGGIADCPSMISIFEPQFEQKKNDTTFLKKVGGLLDRQKCNDSPFFFKVADQLHKLNPSALSARMLAGLKVASNDCNGAIRYLRDAVELETNTDQKAKDLLSIAKCYAVLKQYDQAKSWALKAASARGGWGEPYINIGEWCALAAGQCGDNECTSKAAYWVAVDYFTKARSIDPSSASEASQKITRYSQYFPDKEKCFFYNIKEGDDFRVECWINETTKVRF